MTAPTRFAHRPPRGLGGSLRSGRLTHWIDAQGATAAYRYGDGLSQPTERIDPLGRTLRYDYDTVRNLVALTNPKGERFELAWNLDGRLVGQVGFDGRRQRYEYDAGGRRTRRRYCR